MYDGVDSTSTTLAATANAVKTAYDAATGTDVPDATTSVKGKVMLDNSWSSTSTTKAATPYAVQQMYTTLYNYIRNNF